MMAKPLRVAVIGCGYLGTYHAEKYLGSDKAELVAVVDQVPDRAQELAKRLKVQALTEIEELFKLNIDCASVATDTSAHYSVTSQLLEKSIDVLVEKPITATIEEAKKLCEQADSLGRILQVGHLERFNPAFRAMRDKMEKPLFFEVRRISPFSGRSRDIDVIFDLMIHDLDIIALLTQSPLQKVDAVGVPVITKNIDIANARLTFETGAVANITASRVSFKSERTIRVFQQDGYVSLDFEKKILRMYSRDPAEGSDDLPQISASEHKVEERDALEHQLDSFLDCVLSRKAPEVSAADALRALEMSHQIQTAARKHILK